MHCVDSGSIPLVPIDKVNSLEEILDVRKHEK